MSTCSRHKCVSPELLLTRIYTDRVMQGAYGDFIETVEQYGIISEEEVKVYSSSAIADPTKRRDAKIKMYKAEKEVRTRIEVCGFNFMCLHVTLGLKR